MNRIFFHGSAPPIRYLLLSAAIWMLANLFSGSAQAATLGHSREAIVDAATQFALETHVNAKKVEVSIKPLDNRLNLAACSKDLDLFWPTGAARTGQTTVGVQCQGNHPWKIFVRAAVSVYDSIAVLNTSVIAGDVVSDETVSMQLMDLSSVRGDVVKEVKPLLGHLFKRRFTSGRPLTKTMLERPRLVHKGDDVLIISSAGQLKVRVKGIALADGEQDEVIDVRNATSDRIVQGQVESRGIIRVRP